MIAWTKIICEKADLKFDFDDVPDIGIVDMKPQDHQTRLWIGILVHCKDILYREVKIHRH